MQSGTRMGPYEMVARIGAGGMGEVWRARDTRLDRAVAIKILPAEFAQNTQLRLRFQREARTISSLEHPNICRLYDVGEDYLVMELLEGESLADRVARGALPVREALKYGAQIAEALHRAHALGIVHRDLKPGNIMLTKSGAKLLDFGLARTAALDQGALTEARTAERPLTAEGVVVGTCAYMSPEQVRAEEVDSRSDIFSLGTVLYETLTGRRPFTGASAVETMHAILQAEPPPLGIDDGVPPAIAALVERCMQKDRQDRFQSAGDLAFALTAVLSPLAGWSAATYERPKPRMMKWAIAAGLALLLVTAGVVATRWDAASRPARASGDVIRFQIAFPAGMALLTQGLAISPDGRTLAYVRRSGETMRLHLRSIGSLDDAVLEGSAGAASPFFAADGTALGFVADGKLRKVRLTDGQVTTLAESGSIEGGTWGTDGTIVYASKRTGTLFAVPDAGGLPREITRIQPGETRHSDPQLLPDNRTVLFRRTAGFGTDERTRIEGLDLGTGTRRPIFDTANPGSGIGQFRFVAAGFLVFTHRASLHAIRFDPRRAKTTGNPPVTVIEPMSELPFAVSETGTIVYFSPGAARDATVRVMRVGTAGSEEPLPFPLGKYAYLALSPNDRYLALTGELDERGRILTADLLRGTVSPLSGEGVSHIAIFTPDSERVIYSWTGGGPSNLVMQRADGSDEPETLVASPNHQDPGSVSPDGRWLAYADRDPGTSWDIWLLPMARPRTAPRPYLRSGASEYSPMISPDGRGIAYVVAGADADAGPQVFINTFPDAGRRVHVGVGRYPHWSRDGRRLYFAHGYRIFVVDVSGDDRAITRPRLVAEDAVMSAGYGPAPFAESSDGSLLFMRSTSVPTLTVATNWARELETLMKPKR